MDSPELFVAFGAVMLVIALLGVAIDWFGKPMRHRKFVPKIYRFPDERQPRRSKVRETEWSDTAFVLPVAEPTLDELLVRYPDAAAPDAPPDDVLQLAPVLDHGPPTTQVPGLGVEDAAPLIHTDPLAGIVTLEDQLGHGAADALLRSADHQSTFDDEQDDASAQADDQQAETSSQTDDVDPAQADDQQAETSSHTDGSPKPPEPKTGWTPGEYVFNLTPGGDEPSALTVRNRYWKNVAATAGAGLFGDTNISRMTSGKAPERRNPRTQKLESMRLPHSQYDDTGGETPIPEWPTSELDPFAD